MSAAEQIALQSALAARDAVAKAIADYRNADFGSHVTLPLESALREIEHSIAEVRS